MEGVDSRGGGVVEERERFRVNGQRSRVKGRVSIRNIR